MASRIGNLTIDCRDAFALAGWWKEVLGFVDLLDDPNHPGDPDCSIALPDGSQELLFQQVPEPRSTKNRLHLDLVPTDRPRDAEVERVVALGASLVADLRTGDGAGWVVLADPEGNEFCVVRSDQERHP